MSQRDPTITELKKNAVAALAVIATVTVGAFAIMQLLSLMP